MVLSQLHGVYDAAAGDWWKGVTLGSMIGRSFRYASSDGQMHHGTVRAICDGGEEYGGQFIAVFSSGYSDGRWMSLAAAAELLATSGH